MPEATEGGQKVIKVWFRDGPMVIPDGWRFVQIAATGTDYLGEYHLVVIQRA